MTQTTDSTRPDRDAAFARVMEQRRRGRARPPVVRAASAVAGGLLLLVAAPLSLVLPEVGVPTLLLALRLLAVELDWAARAYAWITWRFGQARRWFRRQGSLIRLGTALAAAAVVLALVWLLVAESV